MESTQAPVYNPSELLREFRRTSTASSVRQPFVETPVSGIEWQNDTTEGVSPPSRPRSMLHTIGKQSTSLAEIARVRENYESSRLKLEAEKKAQHLATGEVADLRERLRDAERDHGLLREQVADQDRRIAILTAENRLLDAEVNSMKGLIPTALEDAVTRAGSIAHDLATKESEPKAPSPPQMSIPPPAPTQPVQYSYAPPAVQYTPDPGPTPHSEPYQYYPPAPARDSPQPMRNGGQERRAKRGKMRKPPTRRSEQSGGGYGGQVTMTLR